MFCTCRVRYPSELIVFSRILGEDGEAVEQGQNDQARGIAAAFGRARPRMRGFGW